MKIIEYSIKNRVIIIFLTIVLIVSGLSSYIKLGKLEDPEFKIKEAIIITLYPGSSVENTEKEVTEKIENTARKLSEVEVDSITKAGYSEVHVKLKDSVPSVQIEQQWDNLRKKLKDSILELPLGALPPVVLDDYGEVYGMFFAITSEGISRDELYKYVKKIRRKLENTQGISKTLIFGKSDEVVEIQIDRAKIANLGINEKMINLAFTSENIPVNINTISHGKDKLKIELNSGINSIEDIKNLVIFTTPSLLNISKGTVVLLRDIAEVKKTELSPYKSRMRYNGKESIGLMLSPTSGTNVVVTGKEINKKIEEIKKELPYGIEIEKVYYQPELVSKAISGFMINLISSVAVVIGVLLISMNFISGMIIGSGLVLSILGTFIVMEIVGINLQRVSLGAFIIAMGMLVDNSIVVVDGILNALEKKQDKRTALIEPTKKTAIPLLGATLIAIISFLPMYLMPNSTGEYIGSLFWIIAISLSLSWIISLTQTPVFCDLYLKENKEIKINENKEKIYRKFKKVLEIILVNDKKSLIVILGIFIVSMLLFIKIPLSFFPDSDKKAFMVNIWNSEGTDIEYTDKISMFTEKELMKYKGVEGVTATVGSSAPRYYVATLPELGNSAFAQIIVNVDSLKKVDEVSEKIKQYIKEHFPNTRIEIRKYINGIPTKYPIQLRILGNNKEELRKYSKEAMDIFRSVNGLENIQTDWKNKKLVIKPVLDDIKKRNSLITNLDISHSLNRAINGTRIGTFRDGEEDIPVIFREKESITNVDSLDQIAIWGLGVKAVPFKELIKEKKLVWEDPIIVRKDGIRAIQIQADVKRNYRTEDLRKILDKKISKMNLKEGYTYEWSGEYYEQHKNIDIVLSFIPLQMLIMFSICIFLFSSFIDSIIVFLVLPLSFIGIIPALLITGKSLGFMSIIGTISLSGMMIKSSIVLLDEIRYQIFILKKDKFNAVVDSSISRIRAVSLAAGTTVLGMLPLIFDPLFSEMAITIIAGLTIATFLILFVVPLLYILFYKIKK